MNTLSLKNSLTLLFIFALFMPLPQQAAAQSSQITISGDDMDVTFTQRMSHTDALDAITNRGGSVDLLLTETDLLIQFSDGELERISREIKKESDESHFAEIIKSMVSSGIRTLLDRAMAIPLYEISEISFSEGTLTILNRDQKDIFGDLEINNTYIMQDFSRRDARRFVGTAERLLD